MPVPTKSRSSPPLPLIHRIGVTGLDKGSEEASARGFLHIDFFWMTLHRHHKTVIRSFEQLRHPIIGAHTDANSPARYLHCLVMQAVRPEHMCAQNLFHEAARLNIHPMHDLTTRQFQVHMTYIARTLPGQILVQAATESYIQ